MNKVITAGLVLMPPPFSAGLSQWSRSDGTVGSPSYQGAADAALVAADQDFGGCLEMQKSGPVMSLRSMANTPILPGCYLRVTARVKAMSGNLPSVRIAAWAGVNAATHLGGVVETGPSVALTAYGKVETVQAIVGTGTRQGVDMSWGMAATLGHFGLDLTGAVGGVVRVDDLVIEDITEAFLRDLMDWVDVRDYGARGDGVTDDSAAVEAADADALATGRTVLFSTGSYFLNADVQLDAPVRFEGTVTMPADRRLAITRGFNLPIYAAAFGSEELGFAKAFQALLNFTDHESLDLGGRRVEVTAPIDMQAAVANKTTFSTRRVIRNGQFNVINGPAWAPTVVTSQAGYAASNPNVLSAVANVANVPVGALVQGTGVGREVYVTAKNIGAGTLTLSQPLYAAPGTQTYTFTRFKYVLDFSNFQQLDKMILDDLDIQCNGVASGVMLAPAGSTFQMRDCYVTSPRDRAITSTGGGCQGMLIDRCQFLSNEGSLAAQNRTSIVFNTNANDVKIRENRATQFRHFGVIGGNGNLLVGNHFFQGDNVTQGVRMAGIVLASTNVRTTITGNYIDNCFVEWTNEYEASPAFASQFSFGGLTVMGNSFMASDVAGWFRWLSIKPYGAGHFIQGLTVAGNVFRCINGTVDRVEGVDTTFAGLDNGRMRNVLFNGNSFNGVAQNCENPALVQVDQVTAAATWAVTPGAFLPFGGWARNVEALVAEGMITGPAGERRSDLPYVDVEQGTAKNELRVNWLAASKGRLQVRVRMDNPL
ncbi:MAG: right-handed parallel beta-helix repeat-containing protein [Paracoccaceae bacterium]